MELEKWLAGEIKTLRENQIKILIEISALQVKSGIWGVIGGSIPVLIGAVVLIWRAT